MNGLQNILAGLREGREEVLVDAELRVNALRPLERMLSFQAG